MGYLIKAKKKIYTNKFTLPELASNGVMGGETFACACSTPKDNAYQCFNNGSDWSGGIDTNPNAAPQWLSFYNPVPLKVTKLRLGQIKNTAEQNNYYITAWKIQVSDDGQDWADVWSGTATKPAHTLVAEIAGSGYHKYYRIYAISANYYSGYPRVFFNGVDFEAEAENAIFYNDDVKTFIFKRKTSKHIKSYMQRRKVRKYYKYISEQWEQPVLTANGTIGSDAFAVSASIETEIYGGVGYAYEAFDNNTNTAWIGMGVTGGKWLTWYNPIALNISKIQLICNCQQGLISLQYSDDNLNWNTIKAISVTGTEETIVVDLDSEPVSAKYWRFYSPVTTYYTMYVNEIKITANACSGIQEVSASDGWDFYKDMEI